MWLYDYFNLALLHLYLPAGETGLVNLSLLENLLNYNLQNVPGMKLSNQLAKAKLIWC